MGLSPPCAPFPRARTGLLPALLHKVLLKDATNQGWEKPISRQIQEGKPQDATFKPRRNHSQPCPVQDSSSLLWTTPSPHSQPCLWVPAPKAEHLHSNDLGPIRKTLAQEDNKCVKVYKHRPQGNHKNHFPVHVLKYCQRGVKKEEGWRPPVPHTLQHKICEHGVKEPCPCLGCLENGQGED